MTSRPAAVSARRQASRQAADTGEQAPDRYCRWAAAARPTWEHLRMEPTNLSCSCCGRSRPRAALHALNGGAYICRRCGLWVALRLRGDRSTDQW